MKGTKTINYSTPKHIQLCLKQNQPFNASKKTHNYCIKSKGKHHFLLLEIEEKSCLDWLPALDTFKCRHCGKKKLK